MKKRGLKKLKSIGEKKKQQKTTQKSMTLIRYLLALDFLMALITSDLLDMRSPFLGLQDIPLF